jgi:hypothetical protein
LTWLTLFAVGFLLFAISATIGAHPKKEWEEPIGAIGWYGFLVCSVVLAGIALSAVVFTLGFLLNRRLPRNNPYPARRHRRANYR